MCPHRFVLLLFALALIVSAPAHAANGPASDVIIEHMAVKLVRGVTNIATSPVELVKQSYLTVKEEGAPGAVIGPLKGLGMTIYRLLMGAGETVLFLVPQPGYYDPMIDPPYVWQGWELHRPGEAK